MLTAAIRADDPVLICSHKHLYGSKGRKIEASAAGEDVPDEPYEIPIGEAVLRRRGRHVTIVSALLMVHRALQAADVLAAEGIDAEVIDIRWVSPLDTGTVVDSVRRTGRLVVVEEGPGRGGWGGTIGAAVADQAFDALDAPIRRLTGPDHPMPFAPHLEAALIPTVERIVQTVRQLTETRG
jgi:pyruvate dehydrogenase E1 component beta subunit